MSTLNSNLALDLMNKYVDIKAALQHAFFQCAFTAYSCIFNKALRYKLFFLKALSKRLWKLTIKTKRLSRLKSLSFLNFND